MSFRLRSLEQLEQVNEYFMTKRYKARVPQVATWDAEEIAIFGYYQQYDTSNKPMLLTNNPSDNNKIVTDVLWTIPKLIDTFHKGFPVTIIDSDENCLELFRNLESYLEHNNNSSSLSLNKIDNIEDSFYTQVEDFLKAYLDLNRKTLEYENSIKYNNVGFTLGLKSGLIGEKLNKSEDNLKDKDDSLWTSNLSWRFQEENQG